MASQRISRLHGKKQNRSEARIPIHGAGILLEKRSEKDPMALMENMDGRSTTSNPYPRVVQTNLEIFKLCIGRKT